MSPKYSFDKIKFATDPSTFEKALALYENGKVTQFEDGIGAYSAIVLGTKPYWVSIESRSYDEGNCDCYMAQHDFLCKHMVAVAIHAVMNGKPLTVEDKQLVYGPTCSHRLGTVSKGELSNAKKAATDALRYIRAYTGPSRRWFAYQGSLAEGRSRLSKIVSELPISRQTAQFLAHLLLRVDAKLLQGGVDDSDGTVGGFIEEAVCVLQEYTEHDPECIEAFGVLKDRETSFW